VLAAFRPGFNEFRRGRIELEELEDRCGALRSWTWTNVAGPIAELVTGSGSLTVIPVGSVAWLPVLTAAVLGEEPLAWRRRSSLLPGLRSAQSTEISPDDKIAVVTHPGPPSQLLRHVETEAAEVANYWANSTIIGAHEPAIGAMQPQASQLAELRVLRALEDSDPGLVTDDADEPTAEWDVTEHASLLARVKDAQLLHLACHCKINSVQPLDSRFLCEPPLTVRDLLDSRLRPRSHVVLSACDSGRTGATLPDESIGPPTAMLGAGAASVCASLWPVVDGYTTEFMADYHRGLRQGANPSDALAACQEARADDPAVLWSSWMIWGA